MKGGRNNDMKCPRCGATMTGGICNNCGFPMNRQRVLILFKETNEHSRKSAKRLYAQ